MWCNCDGVPFLDLKGLILVKIVQTPINFQVIGDNHLGTGGCSQYRIPGYYDPTAKVTLLPVKGDQPGEFVGGGLRTSHYQEVVGSVRNDGCAYMIL